MALSEGYLVIILLLLGRWQHQVEASDHLYPFGTDEGDTIMDPIDDGFNTLQLKQPVNFYGQKYDSITVNANGMITFEGRNWLFSAAMAPFPYDDAVGQNDVSDHIIAPFMEDLLPNHKPPGANIVYFRDSMDAALLEKASQDVRDAFPCKADYAANWAYVVTWYEVQHWYYYYDYCYYGVEDDCIEPFSDAYYDCLDACDDDDDEDCESDCFDDLLEGYSYCSKEICQHYEYGDEDKFNTFQAVVTTDGSQTFAFFNYEDIQWLGAIEGDFAQVGFNHGDGYRAHTLPGSVSPQLEDLDTSSNVAVPGRHGFRIDLPFIKAETCAPGACICQFGDSPQSTGGFLLPTLVDFSGQIQGLEVTPVNTVKLAEWHDPRDPCRFKLMAVVRRKGEETFLANVVFYFGMGKNLKYYRNLKIGSRVPKERGQGIKGANVLDLSTPYVFNANGTHVKLIQMGDMYLLQSHTCQYELEYQRRPVAAPMDLVTLYAGSDVGPFLGECGTCNGGRK